LRGWSWPGPLEGQEPRASSRCTALVRLSSTWLTRERFSRVSVVRDVTPRATTSSTPSSSTSRTRRGRRSSARPLTALLLLTKDVPHTALGVDQGRAVRGEASIGLPAQVGDVGRPDLPPPPPTRPGHRPPPAHADGWPASVPAPRPGWTARSRRPRRRRSGPRSCGPTRPWRSATAPARAYPRLAARG